MVTHPLIDTGENRSMDDRNNDDDITRGEYFRRPEVPGRQTNTATKSTTSTASIHSDTSEKENDEQSPHPQTNPSHPHIIDDEASSSCPDEHMPPSPPQNDVNTFTSRTASNSTSNTAISHNDGAVVALGEPETVIVEGVEEYSTRQDGGQETNTVNQTTCVVQVEIEEEDLDTLARQMEPNAVQAVLENNGIAEIVGATNETSVSALTTTTLNEMEKTPRIPARSSIHRYPSDGTSEIAGHTTTSSADFKCQVREDPASTSSRTTSSPVVSHPTTNTATTPSAGNSNTSIPVAAAVLVPGHSLEQPPPRLLESAPTDRSSDDHHDLKSQQRRFWMTIIAIALCLNSILVGGVVVAGFCLAGKCTSASMSTPPVPTFEPPPPVPAFVPPVGAFPPPNVTTTASNASIFTTTIMGPTFSDGLPTSAPANWNATRTEGPMMTTTDPTASNATIFTMAGPTIAPGNAMTEGPLDTATSQVDNESGTSVDFPPEEELDDTTASDGDIYVADEDDHLVSVIVLAAAATVVEIVFCVALFCYCRRWKESSSSSSSTDGADTVPTTMGGAEGEITV